MDCILEPWPRQTCTYQGSLSDKSMLRVHPYYNNNSNSETSKHFTSTLATVILLMIVFLNEVTCITVSPVTQDISYPHLDKGLMSQYSPDVTKAVAVKTNNYTTWHISKGGQFFAFCISVTIF